MVNHEFCKKFPALRKRRTPSCNVSPPQPSWKIRVERRRALSVRQPYAELIMLGKKKTEYRSKPTRIRGQVYIYASMTPGHSDDFEHLKLKCGDLPTGVLVGTVEVVGSRDGDDCYEWLLANPKRLNKTLRPEKHPQPVWFYPFSAKR